MMPAAWSYALAEVVLPQVLAQLPLAQLLAAARRGNVRQVRVARQIVAERLHDEDVPRRIRQVFLGPDDVRDVEVVVIHRARQVIERRAVGPLNHMVLFQRPVERDGATHQVVKRAGAVARHLEADDGGAASLGLETRGGGGGLRHPAPAVDEALLRPLRRLALCRRLVRGRVVAVGAATVEQHVDGGAVAIAPLGLEVRRARTPHLRPLVPVDAEPAEPVEDRRERLRNVPLAVSVVDPEDELPAVPTGEQPVEQCRPHPADMEVSGRAGCKPRAHMHRPVLCRPHARPSGTVRQPSVGRRPWVRRL